MNKQQRSNILAGRKQGAEMLLFLVVSGIGIYALGNGLTGLFEPGKGIDLLWLAVAVSAMMILFAQIVGGVQRSGKRVPYQHTRRDEMGLIHL